MMYEVDIYDNRIESKGMGGQASDLSLGTFTTPSAAFSGAIDEMARKNSEGGIVRLHTDLNTISKTIKLPNIVIDGLGHSVKYCTFTQQRHDSSLVIKNLTIKNAYYTSGVFCVVDGTMWLKNVKATTKDTYMAVCGYSSTLGRAEMHVDKNCKFNISFSED